MGTVLTFLNLALGKEDSFGRVLAGSTGKGAKTLWQEAGSGGAKGFKKVSNFVHLADTHVENFDKNMNLASDVFDKGTLKALRKSGKTNREYYNKVIDFVKNPHSKEEIAKFLKENGINEVKESRGLFKSIKAFFTGKKATISSVDDIAKNAAQNLEKALGKDAGKAAEGALKSTKGLKGLFKGLKGKGGTIGIILSVGFEAIDMIKAIKNGDPLQQLGRSSFNLAGFASGAAAGAALGTLIPIPVAGSAVGAVVGGLCGFIGGMLGGAVAGKAGEKVFGKSIADKKEEAAEKQAEALEQQKQLAMAQAQGLNLVG